MTRQILTDDMRRRLVEAREAKGWTISDLCEELRYHYGLSSAYLIGNYEIGTHEPTFDMLGYWCNALGLTLKVTIE